MRSRENSGDVRFHGRDPITIAGRVLMYPLAYVGTASRDADASTILTALPVGRADDAPLLPYWPSYASASPAQRARYLDWMARGRSGAIDIGYVFLFFYGLERRALVDDEDEDAVRAEVDRLFDGYAAQSGSFRQYAMNLLAFMALRHWTELDDTKLDQQLGELALDNPLALAGLLAWHHQRRRPLPARYASIAALATNEAKRGTVLQRSAKEVLDLFSLRYHEKFGDGMMLEAAAKPFLLEYSPASGTLQRLGKRIGVKLPSIAGKRAQFDALVRIWNACVDDLKRADTAKKKGGVVAGELTAAAWAALPPELRKQYDHPDHERWDEVLLHAEPSGPFKVTTVGKLAAAADLSALERVTPAQLRKLGDTAALLGVAVEPELRFARAARESDAPVVIWRCDSAETPNRETYLAASSVLALASSVVLSDGATIDEEELRVITRIVEDLFRLDDSLRTRMKAHLEWLTRQPSNALALARKLQSSSKPDELNRLGRLLVVVAAADGTISEPEHKALKALYRALGIAAAELASAIVVSGARLERDEPLVVQSATTGAAGERIPPPPKGEDSSQLNQEAIDALLADTREVAAMLSAVLDDDSGEPSEAPPAAQVQSDGLDDRYKLVLNELVTKPSWSAEEIRALSVRAGLMPGAILDAINAWSDETLGDYLIEDQGDWHIKVELIGRPKA